MDKTSIAIQTYNKIAPTYTDKYFDEKKIQDLDSLSTEVFCVIGKKDG
ncbi:hypothetical protein HGA88_02010 [Candidatus Roizmanbacteria bacterium]|nr:hypothetical protein [Candidatus Roizmanbacteria bacterium]